MKSDNTNATVNLDHRSILLMGIRLHNERSMSHYRFFIRLSPSSFSQTSNEMHIFTHVKQILLRKEKSECFEVCFSSEKNRFLRLKHRAFRYLTIRTVFTVDFSCLSDEGEGEIMSECAYRFTNLKCTGEGTRRT